MNTSDAKLVAQYLADIHNATRDAGYGKREALERFVAWVDERSLCLSDLRVLHLDDYMNGAVAEGGAQFVSKSVTVIRELLKRCYLGHAASDIPVAGWRAKRSGSIPGLVTVPKHEGRVADHLFTVAELKEIFRAGRNLAQSANPEKRAVLHKGLAAAELVYSTGMTLKELSALRLEDLSTAEKGFLWTGGDLPRMVPFTPVARKAVNAWLEQAAPYGRPAVDRVFYSARTLQADTANNIGLSIGRLGKALSVESASKLSQVTLRWAFGAHLLNAGARPDLVAYVLGLDSMTGVHPYVLKARQIADVASLVP